MLQTFFVEVNIFTEGSVLSQVRTCWAEMMQRFSDSPKEAWMGGAPFDGRQDLLFIFIYFYFLKDFIYFWSGKKGEREERNINVRLPLVRPLLGTWPATQACALTGKQTSDPLVCRPALNPLSSTSQGQIYF